MRIAVNRESPIGSRLGRLTGPIFDKELRVSSRRARNFWLRFLYLLALTGFVALAWYSVADSRSGNVAYQTAKMAEAGKLIVATIIGFQFLATQFVAIIMLSTSISDEIYSRTLGVLMTTPITSFQIVMGKLLSKLLQLVLLLAISLPLLAIVRVFGGVPWDYLLAGLCITLTAILFAGSLSLLFSISGQRSYAVILKTILSLAVLYGFLPALFVWLFYRRIDQDSLVAVAAILNPLVMMQLITTQMVSPMGQAFIMVTQRWPLHCTAMFVFSVLVLLRCIFVVRKVALRQATGGLLRVRPWGIEAERRPGSRRRKRPRESSSNGEIREIEGSPVVWKELRAPMIQGGRRHSVIGLFMAIAALLFTYYMGMKDNLLREDNTHMTYALIFMFMALATHVVLSATTLTMEKEQHSWPILLATTLSEWDILWGKIVGILRRTLPIWAFFAAHVAIYIAAEYIHPVAIVHLAILALWIVVFVTGSGLYFSALFRKTTSAVVANLALILLLWVILPVVTTLSSTITRNPTLFNLGLLTNPLVMTRIAMFGDSGDQNAPLRLTELRYRWPDRERVGIGRLTGVLLGNAVVYGAAGAALTLRAKRRMRKHVF